MSSENNSSSNYYKSKPPSLVIIQWINCISVVLSMAVLAFGIFLSTKHEECSRIMATPVLVSGGFILCLSVIGFIGALRQVSLLLWTYFFLTCILLGALASFSIFAFLVTSRAPTERGHHYMYPHDYKLRDYSLWLQHLLNDKAHWEHIRGCFIKPHYCSNLAARYRTNLDAYKRRASMTPIESCCCIPPSECGYSPRNSSFYSIRSPPLSPQRDCKLFSNDIAIRCYNCSICKGAVAHQLRKEWRITALGNIIIFTMIIILYAVAYYARNKIV